MNKIEVLEFAVSKGYYATEDGQVFGPRGKQLKEAIGSNGYKFFGVRKARPAVGTWNVPSHRFIAYVFLGSAVTDAEVVRHLDGNRLNNSISNLVPGSHSENFADNTADWRNKFALAGAAPKRKLSDNDIVEIRGMLKNGDSLSAVSRRFGVAVTTIRQIKIGVTYQWVT